MRVALLAGGTGAAKLAVGLQAALGPGELSVVTNTADDVDFWGLRVCPDTDAVWFWLGDRDLAFHIVRTDLLRRGARLTETALELARRMQVASRVLPMADDDV